MDKLFLFFIYTLKFLILIGDLTLYFLKLFILIPRKAAMWIVKQVRKIYKFTLESGKKFKFQINFPKINLPKIPSLPKLNLKVPKRKPGRKKVKKIKIFPFSTFWIKIRYFFLGFIFSTVFIFTPLLMFIFLQDLPNPNILLHQESAQTTKIYDRKGKLLHQIYANQNRTAVPLSEIPKNLQNATIAIEDRDFYSNPGFDVRAIVRSAIADVSGKPTQGGSTITQQLIKSELLTPEVSITRKVKELILAFWAEKIYSKQEILEMYLNEIPYGGTAWGVEAASQTYFGKNAKDLTLSESAFLAGLPNAPTAYSPFGQNPNLWKKRQKEVLTKMKEQKYISEKEEQDALSQELSFKPFQNPLYAPHFVMYVKDLLVKKYGLAMVERGGLTVRTSLDFDKQTMAEKIVRDQVDSYAYLNLTNGAALVTDPRNGDVLAMVGSKDYNGNDGGNYNATTALRQPGSSIKVVTYSDALTKRFTAATTIDDNPISFKPTDGGPTYAPVNYSGTYHGTLTLRQALANSVNIPAVKLLNAVGVPSMVDLGKKMGISTWGDSQNYGLSITLGAAEVRMVDMAEVYGTLANRGERVDINPVLEITDSKGHVLEKKQPEGKSVLSEDVAFIISDILADRQARAMEFGTNTPLVIEGKTVSVKTGTTDNKRDNWTIGYTPSVVTAVWVGNNDNSPMDPRLTSGITGAAPIWHEIMASLLKDMPDEKMVKPENVIQKPCLGRNEYFIKGTESFTNCTRRIPTSTPSIN